MTGGQIGIVIAVVVASFFALAELAIVYAGRLRLRQWVRETMQGGWVPEEALDRPYRLLSPILVGYTLTVTVAAMLTAGQLVDRAWVDGRGALGLAVASVLVLTPPLYLFGEVVPRIIARARADRLFPTVAWILRFGTWCFRPVTAAADRITGLVLRMFGVSSKRRASFGRRSLDALLAESERVGIVESAEREIIAGVFAFGHTSAIDVMTLANRMVTAPADATAGEITAEIRRTGYSRIPLYRGVPARIVGMVHVFDLFRLAADEVPRSRSVVLARPSMPCDDLLLEMKRRRSHLAIVMQQGRAIGMVTMEDLVEELVGDIRDEHDRRSEYLVPRPTGLVVDAHRSIAEISREHGIDFPAGGAETVAGFLIAQLGRIPKVGEQFRYRGWTIDVLDATPQRVRRVRFRRRDEIARG